VRKFLDQLATVTFSRTCARTLNDHIFEPRKQLRRESRLDRFTRQSLLKALQSRPTETASLSLSLSLRYMLLAGACVTYAPNVEMRSRETKRIPRGLQFVTHLIAIRIIIRR